MRYQWIAPIEFKDCTTDMILKMKIKPSLGNCVDDSAIYEDRKHRTEKV